jgi:EAL domain-containing protein (putative c-di-GMP-specific phosphodiesterase class I)
MARALDLHVVAEGVESPEQLAAVRRLGCRFVQGFLLSKPVAAAELRALLRRDHEDPLPAPGVRPQLEPLNPA